VSQDHRYGGWNYPRGRAWFRNHDNRVMDGAPDQPVAERFQHMVSLKLSQAAAGFELACRSRSLSPNTISDYLNTLRKFQALHMDDPTIQSITSKDIQEFLASQEVSNKSLKNYYIGLSAFWTWCISEGAAWTHIVRKIKPPKPEERAIVPFTLTEIKAILSAVDRSRAYFNTYSKTTTTNQNPYADRNRAMILLLLDTGLRASELCSLKIGDVDLKSRTLTTLGKGSKERHIPFSSRTGQMIWRYLNRAREEARPDEPLFLSSGRKPMTRDRLAHTLSDIGNRAGVSNAHPHRYRHTFAITYLRNGGDIYTLQAILGHSTLEMVRRYLALAQVDLENAHRKASPVENWHL
jgi:integrase/recombinase XerD